MHPVRDSHPRNGPRGDTASRAGNPQGRSFTDSGAAVFDRAMALAHVGSAKVLNLAVVAFTESIPKMFARMHTAMAQGNWAVLQREAHGLRGALGTLGAPAASAVAQRLENVSAQELFPEVSRALAELEQEIQRLIVALNSSGSEREAQTGES
jgi:HPt (histidine-containing phosphotransfer) domain-containing protein